MVKIADYSDQVVEMNGWRDPNTGFLKMVPHSWILLAFGGLLRIKDHLEAIPSIFNHYTQVPSGEGKAKARDVWCWNLVMHKTSLAADEQITLLNTSAHHSPHILAPHVSCLSCSTAKENDLKLMSLPAMLEKMKNYEEHY
jgi:hypothetical protein